MNRSTFHSLLSTLLCVAVLLGAVPLLFGTARAVEEGEQPLAVLWAGSDIQGEGLDGKLLETLTGSVKAAGYDTVDEAFFLGDYADDYDAAMSTAGTVVVRDTLNGVWGLDYDNILMVQGNHDPSRTENIDATGAYDREHYSVYLLNEDDYCATYSDNSRERVMEQVAALKAYLDQKVTAAYDKPIFIITHVPLHNSGRGDNRYARYLFDVLDEAGQKGLNLIYLFGHNHSGGFDRYMGGSCVYRTKGETLLVMKPEQEDTWEYTAHTLHFTYMNPGYVGYCYSGEPDSTISSTVFAVYADRVEIARFDQDGLCNLKNEGAASGTYDRGWEPDSTVVASPQFVELESSFVIPDAQTLEIQKADLKPGERRSIGVDTQGFDVHTVQWSCSGPEVLQIELNEKDPLHATITGLKEGNVVVRVAVADAEGTSRTAVIHIKVSIRAQNSLVEENGGLFYYKNGKKQYGAGLIVFDGSYYYIRSNGQAATGQYWVTVTNGLLPEGVYTFGEDGRMLWDGPVEDGGTLVSEAGGLFYYKDGKKQYGAGLIFHGGSYYYIRSNGQAATGQYWVTVTNGLLPEGMYTFNTDGRLIRNETPDVARNGLVSENGGLYYYIDGAKQYCAGLIMLEGDYYYIRSNGQAATGAYWVTVTNGLLPEGIYTFDTDGKLIR